MARNSTITVTLKGDNKHLRKAFDSADDRAAQFGRNIGRIAAQATAAIAVGTVALGAAAVKQASDLQESANAVKVTFGDEADDIAKLADAAAKGVGLSASEFNGLAVQFSAFAENIAGAGGDVSGVVDDISTRAADFASVMNLDVADAARVFQSGLAGETEPLRKFGIDLSAAAVGAYAVANGIADSASEMTEAQKVQARYGLLMEETNKTQGDFANTSDSLANQQRILSATVKNLGARVGASLLPALEKLATLVAERVVPFLERNLPSAIDAVKRAIEASLPTLTALYEGFRTVVDFFRTNQPAMIGLIAAIAVGLAAWAVSAGLAAAATLLAIAPFVAAAAAIGVLVAGVVYAYQNFETFRTVVDAVRAWLVDTLWPAIQSVAEAIVDVISVMIEAVKAVIEKVTAAITVIWETWGDELLAYIKNSFETMRAVVESVIGVIRGIIKTVTSLIKGDWQGAWDGIKQIVSSAWDGIKAIVSGAVDAVRIGLDAAVDGIRLALTKPYNEAKDLIVDIVDSIVSFVGGMPNRLTSMAGDFLSAGLDLGSSILRGIVDGIAGAVEIVGDIASAVGSAVASAVKTAANGVIDGVNRALEFTIKGPGFLPDITLNPPDIPRFHTGGVVPGPIGREVPIMALAGETVFTRDQMEALGSGVGGNTYVYSPMFNGGEAQYREFSRYVDEHDRRKRGNA